MWHQIPLLVAFLGPCSSAAAQSNSFWSNWRGSGNPWQWPGPYSKASVDTEAASNSTDADSWLEQSQDVLATMQDTYWNGTYWPSTIQWIGALIDTVLASTERSFTDALADGSSGNASQLDSDTRKYFAQIEAYYGGEQAGEIFDEAYDDVQWVVLEWLEAIKFINQYESYSDSTYGEEDIAKFAHRAHIFYNVVQDKYNTSLCEGGLTWNPTLAPYKNAITNELFVSSSISMYLYWPGDNNSDPYPSPDYTSKTNKTLPPLPSLEAHDPLLLQNAMKEWSWFQSHNFTNAQGLIVDGFHISDGQTTCDQRNEMVYSYNQGVVLSGLRGLWEATGDVSYLTDGYNLIETVINATGFNAGSGTEAGQWAGLGRNGIMEDYCDASADCDQDDLIFKGAYFEHFNIFCEPLPTSTPLVAGVTKVADASLASSHNSTCQGYSSWVEHNAYAALSTRDSSSDIIGEWWGASYVNQTQASAPTFAEPKPAGSIDIRNQPWLLNSAPWKCDDQNLCQTRVSNGRQAARLLRSRGLPRRRASSQVRTVETQAQGLSVVNAAYGLTSNRESYSEYIHGH